MSEGQQNKTRWALPVVMSVLLAAIYVVWAPHTADLAAQTARAELFRRSGYVPFWAGWYAGISTTSYSLVTPPLLGWLGAIWLGGASIVATSIVAAPLLKDARRPTLGATLVVVAATLNVVSGRTTFAVGVVVALLAMVAAERERTVVAGLLGLLATATSPVAGVLLLIVAAAQFLVARGRRRTGLSIGIGVCVALVAIAWLAKGEGGGYQPFTRTSLLMAVGTTLVVMLAPVGRRVRMVGGLTIVTLLAVYVVHSPIGANATRIAILGAAPAIAAASRGRLLTFGAFVIAVLLPIAQLHNDLSAAGAHDHDQAFVAPLLTQLESSELLANHRVELVDTATHWPSTYLLPTVTLARGWERQVDESRNPLFYGRAPLTATTYRSFLDRNAVSLVAVAHGVPLDYGVTREAALINTGLPYLTRIATDAHWTLYSVRAPTAIVASPATFRGATDTGVSLEAPAPGSYDIRLQWSPYLVVSGGTVSRTVEDSVRVNVTSAGVHDLHAVWRIP